MGDRPSASQCIPVPSSRFAQPRAPLRALRDKQLHLGHSMASSALSSLTTKTGSR